MPGIISSVESNEMKRKWIKNFIRTSPYYITCGTTKFMFSALIYVIYHELGVDPERL